MNQYLLFRSNGVTHGIKIKYVSGTGTAYGDDYISASECFYRTKEMERHFIRIGDRILSVSGVLDIVNVLKSHKVPPFFRTTPISEVTEINGEIVVLLNVEKMLEKCLNKGENHGQ